jgi:hypothetical protein
MSQTIAIYMPFCSHKRVVHSSKKNVDESIDMSLLSVFGQNNLKNKNLKIDKANNTYLL